MLNVWSKRKECITLEEVKPRVKWTKVFSFLGWLVLFICLFFHICSLLKTLLSDRLVTMGHGKDVNDEKGQATLMLMLAFAVFLA